jgi:hypothetical protein
MMTAADIVRMLSHYPTLEVKAFDPETGDLEPVAAIALNAADESVELITSRRTPCSGKLQGQRPPS